MVDSFPNTFNANLLGRSFRELSSEILRTTHHEIVRRWLHSDHDAELFVWATIDKQIVKQQFFCFGQVVEWNAVEGVRTGAVIFDELNQKQGEVIHFDLTLQAQSLDQACSVIRQIEVLTPQEREFLCQNFLGQGLRSGGGIDVGSLSRPVAASPFKRLVTRIKAWFKI